MNAWVRMEAQDRAGYMLAIHQKSGDGPDVLRAVAKVWMRFARAYRRDQFPGVAESYEIAADMLLQACKKAKEAAAAK